jgi:hypothetical protein
VRVIFAALSALFLTVTPPSIAQDTGNTNTYRPTKTANVCAKINEIDRLVTNSGETLFLTSKSSGDSDEFKINVYVNQKTRKFTIVKTYAKRNQACIVLSGYDIELKNNVKPEPKEEPNE